MKEIFSKEVELQLDIWIAKFPEDQARSALLAGLHIIQDANGGFLTNDLMYNLSLYLKIKPIEVYEVATFYSMYNLKKIGSHQINVCDNISCMLNGASKIIKHIENVLNIKVGETTTDNRVTLKTVECQGACCGAPMLEVDKVFYENLTIAKVDKILASLK